MFIREGVGVYECIIAYAGFLKSARLVVSNHVVVVYKKIVRKKCSFVLE